MHQYLESDHNGAKYLYIFICRYSCMHMRVHTFIHQYQYRYTNTEGYDDASIMCGDSYTLTTSKVSTWAVPATRLMETSFRQESFQKLSVLSAQAAGSEFSAGPCANKNAPFSVGVLDALCIRNRFANSLRSGFFATSQKCPINSPHSQTI